MNRRFFLAVFGAALTDPERLLWIPGDRRIFLPPPGGWSRPLRFYPDAFSMVMEPLAFPPGFVEAWKLGLAQKIDIEALNYAQRIVNGLNSARMDALRPRRFIVTRGTA